MSEHLQVHKFLNQLRGYAKSRPADEHDWLCEVTEEIERLVGITHDNFLKRGKQLETAHKYSDVLEVRLGMQDSPTPEQPQTPDLQSSEGESTETMVETVADDAPVIPGKSNLAADYVKHSSFDPGIAALSNGTTHPEQQD